VYSSREFNLMINVVKAFVFLAALLLLPEAALGGGWLDESGTALNRPTATATRPSTSPIVQPGQLVYTTYVSGGTLPPPLDIKSCKDLTVKFHPDYGGSGTYTAEVRIWDCHQGAPTLDESVAAFTEEYYCDRILGDFNGGGVDNVTLNGDDGTDRDGDLLEEQRSKIFGVKGAFLHVEYAISPSAETTRTTVICEPQTN
jgi:hypothetical protein